MSLEAIEPPSKEVLEKVRGEFGLNEQRVREAVELLKDWIHLQPHLPKEIGTFWLRQCEQHHTVHNSKQIISCSKYLCNKYFLILRGILPRICNEKL